MNKLFNTLSAFFGAMPDRLRPYRLIIVIFALLSTLFMGFGIARFQLDTSFDAWLSQDDPAVQALDDFRSQFGSDDGMFIVYRAKDGDVFSPASLSSIRDLTLLFENWQDIDPASLGIDDDVMMNLEHIERVQSLSNTRYQVSTVDTLESRLLVPEGIEITQAIADEVADIADAQPIISLLLFSKNHEYGAIVMKTDFGAIPVESEVIHEADDYSDDALDLAFDSFVIEVDETAVVTQIAFQDTKPDTYLNFMTALQAIYQQEEYAEAFEFFPIGTASMLDFSMQVMTQSSILLFLAGFVIVLLLYTLFHAGAAVVWPITAIAASCIWMFGGLGWSGIPSTQLVYLGIMLVLAVGIADCVHVMSEYLLFRRQGMEHKAAISKSYAKTGVPIMLTTITTMAGMMAIGFGGVGQFVIFGISSAGGVFVAFAFTIIVLPALMEYWHPDPEKTAQPKVKSNHPGMKAARIILSPFIAIRWVSRKTGFSWLIGAIWLQPLLDKVPEFSNRWRYPIIAMFFAIFAACGYGASQVHIDSNIVELFRKGSDIRTAYEIVDEHMAGTGSMEIMIDLKTSDGMSDPKVLMAIDHLQEKLETDYGLYVVRTNSLADLVKGTNKIMNADNPDFYTIPDDHLMVSQLLYLFNSSNPEDRRSLVSDDYSRSHITIQLRNAGSYEYAKFFGEIQSDIDTILVDALPQYPDMQTGVTGSWAMMMRMADVIAQSQFKSLSLAVLIISLILILTLGSIQGGLLAIIPNMLPAVLAFGLMGLMGIPLDADTLMIAPLIIGIAVDDTIHFVTHYRMALAKGLQVEAAVVQTVKEVGQAVTFTSLVLGISFAMLAFSDYLGLVKVGVFGSLAIFVALLCDLLFLPALIYVFKPRFGVKPGDAPLASL